MGIAKSNQLSVLGGSCVNPSHEVDSSLVVEEQARNWIKCSHRIVPHVEAVVVFLSGFVDLWGMRMNDNLPV